MCLALMQCNAYARVMQDEYVFCMCVTVTYLCMTFNMCVAPLQYSWIVACLHKMCSHIAWHLACRWRHHPRSSTCTRSGVVHAKSKCGSSAWGRIFSQHACAVSHCMNIGGRCSDSDGHVRMFSCWTCVGLHTSQILRRHVLHGVDMRCVHFRSWVIAMLDCVCMREAREVLHLDKCTSDGAQD